MRYSHEKSGSCVNGPIVEINPLQQEQGLAVGATQGRWADKAGRLTRLVGRQGW
jgi:hypothetical protein